MNERDSAVTGIVEMSYNWLSYGVVGNSVCRTWESCTLAFPCAVNRVIHGGIASYAHFHDADFKYLKLFGWTHIIILIEIRERVNEDVRVYFCPGSGEEMGHFRKTGAKAM